MYTGEKLYSSDVIEAARVHIGTDQDIILCYRRKIAGN